MIAWAALSFAYDKREIKLYTQEVNGMLWEAGKFKFKPQIKDGIFDSESLPELEKILLTIYDSENKIVFNKYLYIDWDMFGSGFVRAMQVDTDPELEIVFYVNPHHNSSFYLDINQQTGKIETKNFESEASPEDREMANDILIGLYPAVLVLLMIFVVPIAFVLGLLGRLGRYIFNKDKQKRENPTGRE